MIVRYQLNVFANECNIYTKLRVYIHYTCTWVGLYIVINKALVTYYTTGIIVNTEEEKSD